MMTGRQYFNQTTVLGIQRIASKVLMLFYWILITAVFSLQEIGIIAILALVVSIGEPVSLVRVYTYAEYQISHSLGKRRWDVINGVIIRTIVISLGIAGLLGVGIYVVARPIVGLLKISSEYILLIQLTSLAIAVSPLSLLGQSYLSGLLRGNELAVMTFVQPLTLFISGFILFPYVRLLGLPVAWVVSSSSSFLVALYFVRDIFGHPRTTPSLKEVFTFTLPLCGAGVVNFFASRTDQLLVLGFLGVELLGLYYLILEAISVLQYLSSTVLRLFFPTISESLEHGTVRTLAVFSKGIKFTFMLSLPLFMFTAIAGFPFLSVVFFGKVLGGQLLFILMCTASVFYIFKRINVLTLLADGHKNIPLQLAVISLIMKLTVYPILLFVFPLLEMVGVAYMVELFVVDVSVSILFTRKLDLSVPWLILFKLILLCGLTSAVLFVLSMIFGELHYLILEVFGVTLLYLVLLSISNILDRDDFSFLRNATPRPLHRVINVFQKLNSVSGWR